MAEKITAYPPIADEEQKAQRAARLAALDAKLSGLFSDMDHDAELRKREQEYRADLAHKKYEKKSFTDKTVYVDVNAKLGKVYAELEEEEPIPTRGENESLISLESTEEGLFYSIPDFSPRIKEDWGSVTYVLEVPDEIIVHNGYKEVRKSGSRLQLELQRNSGGFHAELVDKEEPRVTRLRLSGDLLPIENERLMYFPDPGNTIHDSVKVQSEKSITQMMQVLDAGQILQIEDFDDDPHKNNGNIGFGF